MTVCLEDSATVPHTLAGDYFSGVPATNGANAETVADAQLRQLLKNTNFISAINEAAEGYWRNEAEASGSSTMLRSRMLTVKTQDKMDAQAQKRQQLAELEKAKRLEEQAKSKTEAEKRFRRLLSNSAKEEEEGMSEWEIFMRGGISIDEMMMLATLVKPAQGGITAPSLAVPRPSLMLAS